MIFALKAFFSPPEYDSVERSQKAKFLHVALLTAAIAGFFLGLLNLPGETDLSRVLFVLSGIFVLCVPLNQRGLYFPVAVFFSTLVIAAITFSLIDGVGLRDAGMLAYPIFIVFTAFLFSKKAAPVAALFSIASACGVYYLDSQGRLDPGPFSPNDQLVVMSILLVVVSLLLWVIMDNWENILNRLRNAYDLTLMGWAKALEYRDRETEGHSQRVADLSLKLARRVGCPKIEFRGALLHDIGKLALPDSILLKEGRLTEAEWECVKKHPQYAREMLAEIPFLQSSLDIPYYHHEKWDGSGYPEGLSGEDIPLSARIFAVVDVWDALLSDRPYRPAWTEEKARAYLQEQSGKQFDPKIVAAFFDMIGGA